MIIVFVSFVAFSDVSHFFIHTTINCKLQTVFLTSKVQRLMSHRAFFGLVLQTAQSAKNGFENLPTMQEKYHWSLKL
jgi:hypothetical protein